MLIIPALDLRRGKCVRLVEGRPETEHVYSEDPVAQAKSFVARGAERLHVVDLDGAFSGHPENMRTIASIIDAVDVPVQVGGGLRDFDAIDAILDQGARFAILGTIVVSSPELLDELCRLHPGQIIVGIDARDGLVRTNGWLTKTEMTARECARLAETYGACAIIHTDIARDGTGCGLNVAASDDLARSVEIPVLASGGVRSIADIRALKGTAVSGVVIGRALYDGTLDLAEAIEEAAGR